MNRKTPMNRDDTPRDAPDPAGSRWTLVLVVVQLAGLLYLALTGPVASGHRVLLAVELAALLFGLWALVVVRPWNINVAPAVKIGARLVTRGPYRWIRHPMYATLLVLTSAWLADTFTPTRLAVWAAFTANMFVKMLVEERYLARHFAEYAEYKSATWRVVPFVF